MHDPDPGFDPPTCDIGFLHQQPILDVNGRHTGKTTIVIGVHVWGDFDAGMVQIFAEDAYTGGIPGANRVPINMRSVYAPKDLKDADEEVYGGFFSPRSINNSQLRGDHFLVEPQGDSKGGRQYLIASGPWADSKVPQTFTPYLEVIDPEESAQPDPPETQEEEPVDEVVMRNQLYRTARAAEKAFNVIAGMGKPKLSNPKPTAYPTERQIREHIQALYPALIASQTVHPEDLPWKGIWPKFPKMSLESEAAEDAIRRANVPQSHRQIWAKFTRDDAKLDALIRAVSLLALLSRDTDFATIQKTVLCSMGVEICPQCKGTGKVATATGMSAWQNCSGAGCVKGWLVP